MEEALVTQLVVGLVVQIVVTGALAAWGRWVEARMGGGAAWKWARRGPWLSFALVVPGMLLGIWLITRAFGAVQTASPEHRARALAEGLSTAMNVSALFFLPGYLILLASLVTFIVGSVRAAR